MNAMPLHLACGEIAAFMPAQRDWLSASERARLATLRTPQRREQFIAARWLARWLLGQALGGTPRDWELNAPVDAPPSVTGRPELFLSVSHSGAWVACALASEAVGLDLEAPRRERDIASLIDVCCTPGEQAWFAGLEEGARSSLFYELWTVKEAWLKRRREWIAPSRLRQIETQPEGADARSWRGAGWSLALCRPADAQWHTPQPADGRSWKIADTSDELSLRA